MLSRELDKWKNKYNPLIQIVEETPIESEEGIYFVEKYQEVNRIVEEILKHVGGEVSQDGLKPEVRYSVRDFVIWMRFLEETTDWLQNLQMRQKSWM